MNLQARQHAARLLARVLAEAVEFVAGEDRAFHRGADVLGEGAEIERDIGAPSLSRCLIAAPAARRSVSGSIFVLLAEADDERALVLVAQQDSAAEARRRIRRPARRRAGRRP